MRRLAVGLWVSLLLLVGVTPSWGTDFTTNYGWQIPVEGQKPYYQSFFTLMNQIDATVKANQDVAIGSSRSVLTGTGLQGGGDLTSDRTLSLANTAVSAGSYTRTSLTVDAQGRLTTASSGAAPITALTCLGDDKLNSVSAAGVFTCAADQLGGGGGGISSLNSLTGASQSIAVGTTGTDYAIVSTGTSHTLNLPSSSASNRGALLAADWSTFNAKEAALTFSSPLVRTTNTIACPTCTTVSGIISLGGLTGATQTLATATTGTNFTITSTGTSHTFAIPDAGVSARGLVTTGAQTFGGVKTMTLGDTVIKGPSPWIDVKAYGAIGNGTADDTTAIQNAINAASVGQGGVVFFPVGSYMVSATVTVNFNNITLRGAGIGVTRLLRSPSMASYTQIFRFLASDGLITALTLDGNNITNTYAELRLGGSNNTADGIKIINNTFNAIAIDGSNIKVLNSTLIGLSSATIGLMGINIEYATSSNVLISNNIIQDQQRNAIFGGGRNIAIVSNVFTGNHRWIGDEGGQVALTCVACAGENTNLSIVGNTFEAGGSEKTWGIEADSENEVISGNTIRGHKAGGIQINHGNNILVTGNIISNSGYTVRNAPGIWIGSPLRNITITDNEFLDDQTVKTQNWAIQIDAINLDYYNISGNNMRGSTNAAGLSDLATGTHKTIYGNLTNDASSQSALFSYLRFPDGTTQSTASSAGGAWIDVKSYGAVCNGTTDDTTAITNAIAALPATNGTLLISGWCKVTSTITLNKNDVTVMGISSSQGTGHGASGLLSSALSSDILKITGNRVRVTGLRFDYTAAAASGTPAVRVQNAQDVQLDHLTMWSGNLAIGILLDAVSSDTYRLNISDSSIVGVTGNGIVAQGVSESARIGELRISNVFLHNTAPGGNRAIYLKDFVHGVYLTGINVYGWGSYGLHIGGSTTSSTECGTGKNTCDIFVGGASVFDTIVGAAIFAENTNRVTISGGNWIKATNAGTGISLASTVTEATIDGNIIPFNAIGIDVAGDKNQMTSNYFPGPNTTASIRLQASASDNLVASNAMRGVTASITDVGTNNLIYGNWEDQADGSVRVHQGEGWYTKDDLNFAAIKISGNPTFNMDAEDYIQYDRTANKFVFYVGSSGKASFAAGSSGVQFQDYGGVGTERACFASNGTLVRGGC